MLHTTIDFKEQMAEARRNQILMGAAQVFAQKGYHKATTREIAQAAGVAEGTIYNYFGNKRELLLAMIELLATQSLKDIIFYQPPADPIKLLGTQSLKDTITHQPPVDPKEFIKLILWDRYHLVQERGHLIAPIMAEMFSDPELREEVYRKIAMPLASHLEHYIQTHIDSGLFRPVNPMVVTRAFIGAIIINFAMKLANLDPRYANFSADALIEELASLFMGMLLIPERASEQ
jgi:AcrR family transcriptional regulator